MPTIKGMSQNTLLKFLDNMRIVDVAFYGNPDSIHLFLASPSIVGRTNALLTVTAQDDELVIELQGTDEAERPRCCVDICANTCNHCSLRQDISSPPRA